MRRRHQRADLPWLWLGKKGKLTDSGIAQAIRTHGEQASIEGLHPHAFQHSWRHYADKAGLSETYLMTLGGWKSSAMLRRHASTGKTERALDGAKRAAVGDTL
ncbi:MAG: hypothetical protein ACLQHS_10250 [Candidatus Limnocylindrales bacterium]